MVLFVLYTSPVDLSHCRSTHCSNVDVVSLWIFLYPHISTYIFLYLDVYIYEKYLELLYIFKVYINIVILYGISSIYLLFSLNILVLESVCIDISSFFLHHWYTVVHHLNIHEYIYVLSY